MILTWFTSPWTLTAIVAALLGCVSALLVAELRVQALATKVRAVLHRDSARIRTPPSLALLIIHGMRRLGEKLRDTTFFSHSDILELERTVSACGLDAGPTASAVIGAKLLLFILLPTAVYMLSFARSWSPSHQLVGTAMAVPAALLLPNWTLGILRKSYREALRRGLPDALDLMVVCAEAGLGFETMLERVATEMRVASRAVALELVILEQELRVTSDRRDALTRFGQRSGLEGFRRLSGTLIQTLHYGTPLAHGLRILSREMRQERLTAFEEQAARLPALLVPPLILFIMPCLFIVLLGPSVVQLMSVFGSM